MNIRGFLKFTALGRFLLVPFRFFLIGLPRAATVFYSILKWSVSSKEYYNYTYDLTSLNRDYLASFVAVVAGADHRVVRQFIQELDDDEPLRSALRNTTLRSRDRHNADVEPRYGRRLGWYALVRATKPRLVLETGVDRGLGTVVLAAAMHRNAQEGYPGLVYATDIVPDCGYLIVEPYKQYVRILLGDSVESLRKFQQPVDIFLHDSDHRAEYEWAEFMAIEPNLHAGSLILSDNSNQTSKLLEFSERLGKSFLYFQDQPQDHWWPGDGIGAAFVPGVKTFFPGRKL